MPVFPKWRGKQVLMRDENGLEKCVACGLCAVACPADAIYLEAAENDGSVQGAALREGLSDPQDALHLLRILRRSLPVSAIGGQGLRACEQCNKDFIWDKHDLLVLALPGGAAADVPATALARLRLRSTRLRLPGSFVLITPRCRADGLDRKS